MARNTPADVRICYQCPRPSITTLPTSTGTIAARNAAVCCCISGCRRRLWSRRPQPLLVRRRSRRRRIPAPWPTVGVPIRRGRTRCKGYPTWFTRSSARTSPRRPRRSTRLIRTRCIQKRPFSTSTGPAPSNTCRTWRLPSTAPVVASPLPFPLPPPPPPPSPGIWLISLGSSIRKRCNLSRYSYHVGRDNPRRTTVRTIQSEVLVARRTCTRQEYNTATVWGERHVSLRSSFATIKLHLWDHSEEMGTIGGPWIASRKYLLSQTTEYILPNSIGIALHNSLHARSFYFVSFPSPPLPPFLSSSYLSLSLFFSSRTHSHPLIRAFSHTAYFSFPLSFFFFIDILYILSNHKFLINIKHVYKHRLITSVFTIIYD